MSTPNPPSIGDTGWGTELNDYLETTLQPEITANTANFSAHVASAPASTPSNDPHGDRAYANSLFAPIQQFINLAMGFIQLDINERLPSRDPWHDHRPCSGNFEAGSSIWYPPQYRINLDGEIRFAGYVILTAYEYNGVDIFTAYLTSPYRPNKKVHFTVTIYDTGGAIINAGNPKIIIDTDGSCQFDGLPDGLAAGIVIGIYGTYPADDSCSFIQD